MTAPFCTWCGGAHVREGCPVRAASERRLAEALAADPRPAEDHKLSTRQQIYANNLRIAALEAQLSRGA